MKPQDWAKWARVEPAALCLSAVSGNLMGIGARFVGSSYVLLFMLFLFYKLNNDKAIIAFRPERVFCV